MVKLSEKGEKLKQQLYKDIHKCITVQFTDTNTCKTEVINDEYIITLSKAYVGLNELEYLYLHELFHVYQFEMRYPILVCGDSNRELQEIDALLYSLVLDINLDTFFRFSDIAIPINLYSEDAKRIKNYFEETVETIDSLLLVTLYAAKLIIIKYFGDKKETNDIMTLVKTRQRHVYRLVEDITCLIERNNKCKTKEDCYVILCGIKNTILQEYGIGHLYAVRNS